MQDEELPLMGEIMRELCEVMSRQREVALDMLNGGIGVGKMERMGRLADRAYHLQQRILGEPWIGVTRDKEGNWVLRDGALTKATDTESGR